MPPQPLEQTEFDLNTVAPQQAFAVRHVPDHWGFPEEAKEPAEEPAGRPVAMEDAGEELALGLAQLVIAQPEPCDQTSLQQYCTKALLETCPILRQHPNLLALGVARLQLRIRRARLSLNHDRVEIANNLLERIDFPQAPNQNPPVYQSPVSAAAFQAARNVHAEEPAGPMLIRRAGRVYAVPNDGAGVEANGEAVPVAHDVPAYGTPWTVSTTAQACTELESRPVPPAPRSLVCVLGRVDRAKRFHHFRCRQVYTSAAVNLFKPNMSLQPATDMQLLGCDCCHNCRRHFRRQ